MQSMTTKLCSVIVPAYNSQQYIEQAIYSVITQTYTQLELIVIDDCSTDQTVSIVERIAKQDKRIRLHCNYQNLGVAKTRNIGFDLAQGEYIALLDADDIWLPNKLELQITQMTAVSATLCYSSYSFIDENSHDIRKPYIVPNTFTFKQFLTQNYIGCSTAIFLRSFASEHRMNPTYSHEDYVFWLELLKTNCIIWGITTPLVKYRISVTSRSSHKGNAARNRWKIYRDFLHLNRLQSFIYFIGYAISGFKKHLL